MSRLEAYIVAIATIVISALLSAFSAELRDLFKFGLRSWLGGRRNSAKVEYGEVSAMHDDIQYLIVIIGIRFIRIIAFGSAAAYMGIIMIINKTPVEGSYEGLFFNLCIGGMTGQLSKLYQRLFRVATFDTWGPKMDQRISELEERIAVMKSKSDSVS